jgi:hypothetical protein
MSAANAHRPPRKPRASRSSMLRTSEARDRGRAPTPALTTLALTRLALTTFASAPRVLPLSAWRSTRRTNFVWRRADSFFAWKRVTNAFCKGGGACATRAPSATQRRRCAGCGNASQSLFRFLLETVLKHGNTARGTPTDDARDLTPLRRRRRFTEALGRERVEDRKNSMNVRVLLAALIGAVLFFVSSPIARAEGGAGPEAMSMGNMCMVMYGYDMIHITAYLPGKSRSEFCEEIPATGKVILVFDIENPKFRDMPIEVRIIRDPLTPITKDTDLEALTEVFRPAKLYRTGTFNIEHDFQNNGHYIGLVTVVRETGERDTQQFKFSVGEVLWLYVPYFLAAVFLAMCVAAFWRHSHPKPKGDAAA